MPTIVPVTYAGREAFSAARGHPSLERVALVLEAQRLLLELRHDVDELGPSLLALGVEALDLEDVPVAQHWRDHVVAVLADVVDAGDRHLHGLALEAGDVRAGHLEGLHYVGDRLHRLVRVELERGPEQVA